MPPSSGRSTAEGPHTGACPQPGSQVKTTILFSCTHTHTHACKNVTPQLFGCRRSQLSHLCSVGWPQNRFSSASSGSECGSPPCVLPPPPPPPSSSLFSCLSEGSRVMCGQPLIKLSEDCLQAKTLSARMNITISLCLWIVFRVAFCFSTLIHTQHH